MCKTAAVSGAIGGNPQSPELLTDFLNICLLPVKSLPPDVVPLRCLRQKVELVPQMTVHLQQGGTA